MEFPRNKATLGAIVMILLLAISAFAVAVPRTNAQAIPPGINIPQWTYINAFPPPVGVGQPISIFLWTANLPPTGSGAYGDRWTGMYVVVTAPDGTNYNTRTIHIRPCRHNLRNIHSNSSRQLFIPRIHTWKTHR